MDKLKEKLNTLRTEADQAALRADQVESELRKVEAAFATKGLLHDLLVT
jgi:hypothetical protein